MGFGRTWFDSRAALQLVMVKGELESNACVCPLKPRRGLDIIFGSVEKTGSILVIEHIKACMLQEQRSLPQQGRRNI